MGGRGGRRGVLIPRVSRRLCQPPKDLTQGQLQTNKGCGYKQGEWVGGWVGGWQMGPGRWVGGCVYKGGGGVAASTNTSCKQGVWV